jgi:RNA polymerase primary sigma factor
MRSDANTRARMIEANLGLVRYVARSYSGSGVEFDELVQEGTVGLVKAVDRFDPARGRKLSTYAVWWIRSAMLEAIRRSKTIRIPARAKQRPAVMMSLDAPVAEDGAPLGELLADERAPDPSAAAVTADEYQALLSLLELLPARHREVIRRRYGLGGTREQTHQEIGAWLGVGENRSRQIEREALHRLRTVAGATARLAA